MSDDDGDAQVATVVVEVTHKKRARESANDDGGWMPGTMGKNKWRYQEGSEKTVVEILMVNDHITLIDACDYEKAAPHRWCRASDGYAKTNVHTRGKHINLFPGIAEPRDHLNGNKLDNRRINIDSGANGANVRNKEDKGVSENAQKRNFVVKWTPFGSDRPVTKMFSWETAKFPSKESAKEAAFAFRKEQAGAALAAARKHNHEHGAGTRVIRTKPARRNPSNTGVQGLRFETNNRTCLALRAEVTINGIKYSKYFPGTTLMTREEVLECGKQWLAETKATHPRNRPIARKRGNKQKTNNVPE